MKAPYDAVVIVDRLIRGAVWRRTSGPKSERGRLAVIVSRTGSLVEYRYREARAESYGRKHTRMQPRTNTTCMTEANFIRSFAPTFERVHFDSDE